MDSAMRLLLLFQAADLGLTQQAFVPMVDELLDAALIGRPLATEEQRCQEVRAELLELQLRQVLRGKVQASVSGGPSVTYDRRLQVAALRQELRAAYALAGLPQPGRVDWNQPGISVPVRATFGGGW